MALQLKRILIPVIILLILLATGQSKSAGQTLTPNSFLPLIVQNQSGWIGPDGGTVVALAIDPSNPQTIYAGSYGSGVFKSLDGGISWQEASQGLTNLYIYSLAVDPTHPATLYAGTYHNQVYKSEDGGNTWHWSGGGMQASAIVYSLAIDPVIPANVYAATRGISNNGNPPWNGVLYKSTDGGSTWQARLQNLGGMQLQDWVYGVTVNPHAHNEIYIASHEDGLFRSSDYGDTWQAITSGIHENSGRSIVIAPHPDYPIICFYGVWHNDTIFKSTNGCNTWINDDQGIPNKHVYSISIDPQNANNVYLATFSNGIIKSIDGGVSWQPSGLPLDGIYAITINPSNTNDLLAGTEGDGVHHSINAGASWSPSSTGIENATVDAVVISPTDPKTIFASLPGAGVYQSVDRGHTWNAINAGLTDLSVLDLVMDPANPGLLFALTSTGGLFQNYLYNSNGWISSGPGLPLASISQPALPADHPLATLGMQEAFSEKTELSPLSPTNYATLMKMIYAPSNPQIAYLGTGGAGMYRSSNGGQSWQAAGLGAYTINSLAVDRSNPSIVYAVSSIPGSTYYYGALQVSTDGGLTWNTDSSGMNFYSISASPAESGILYAGTNDGIYRFQSGAWTPLGLKGQSVTAIQPDPIHPERLFAGTELGAYYSINNGETWAIAGDNLMDQTIEAITLDPTDPNIAYISTKTHGIYLLQLLY